MSDIIQSDFQYNLGDKVIISNPVPLYESVRNMRGTITHRGFQDTTNKFTFPNLYCIFVNGEGAIPGIPENSLELDSFPEGELA